MRGRTLIFLLVWIAAAVTSRLPGQNPLGRPVDFSCTDCTPSEALVQLSRQTQVNIVFNERFFLRCPALTISVQQEPLQDILDRISACSRVAYRMVDDQVVFYRRKSRYSISGYIQDGETGERLIGAGIRVASQRGAGTVSNEFGFFSLTLDEGTYPLVVSYIGYRSEKIDLNLQGDRVTVIRLRPEGALPEVVITALPTVGGMPQTTSESSKNLPLKALASAPMPGGEADLMRLAALQAGVQTGVDGLGGLHVRGGNADQNLILLDDVPVYNPNHALGLFSVFNPATVSNARLWKGDFPARYAGRASSVLDIRTRDGNFRQYHANAVVGLFASSLAVEGPVRVDRSSFLLAVRGTYFEPWVRFLSQQGKLLTIPGEGITYRFHDVNFKANYLFSERSRLYLSYYRGGDKFRNQYNQRYARPEGIVTDSSRLVSDWGNEIAALRWNYLIGPKFFTNTTLRYSRILYRSRLRFISNEQEPKGKPNLLTDFAFLYQTDIRDWSGKTDFTFFPNDRLTLRGGLAFTLHDFQPGALSANFLLPGQSTFSVDSLSELLTNNDRYGADEGESYVDAEWRFGKHYRLDAGINFTIFQIRNLSYNAAQPRLRVQRSGPQGWSQWAGFHRTAQFLHQIGSFNISFPFELWVPTTSKVPPERVWQASLGAGWQRRGWGWQVEAYYKKFERVLTFRSGVDALYPGYIVGAEEASGWEDRTVAGTGHSQGLEVLLEKNQGSLTGSIAYTWSESIRQFPGINSGRPFPSRFDRRHDLKISLRQRLLPWLDADAVWAFATGNPITLAGVKFQHKTPGGPLEREVLVYTGINGYRLPTYHRLDLALNARFTTGPLEHAVQIGVYNVYNRANPFFLHLDAGSGVKGKAIQYTLLPLLPALRYEIKI